MLPIIAGIQARGMVKLAEMVTKLDRRGQSTRDLLDLIDHIDKAGAAFPPLGDPLRDTRRRRAGCYQRCSPQSPNSSTIRSASGPAKAASAPW